MVREGILHAIQVTPIVLVRCSAGSGASTVMKHLAYLIRARVLGAADWLQSADNSDPYDVETAIAETIHDALRGADTLILEEIEYLPNAHAQLSKGSYFFDVVLRSLLCAPDRGKRVIFCCGQNFSSHMLNTDRATVVDMPRPTPADYGVALANFLGAERAAGIDTDLLYRFATELNLHQLRLACAVVAQGQSATAADLIDCLREYSLKTNAKHREIEKLSFDDLPGFEDIARKLDIHVVLPLTNPELARARGLTPKRGVLLYGPPGSGKTSVGRALAQRMRGKFFLIDGNFHEQPAGYFFFLLNAVVAEAQANAPCVLFIDDADVLFKQPLLAGLTRFLLSLLDGMQSGRSSKVCVMMTAMDVRLVPDALLRSGRIELWLETQLPDAATCARVLRARIGAALPHSDAVDYDRVGELAAGLTPADLRRVAGDAMALYGYDLSKGRKPHTAQVYLEKSLENLREDRRRMQAVLDAA